jgi:hypothetical protein
MKFAKARITPGRWTEIDFLMLCSVAVGKNGDPESSEWFRQQAGQAPPKRRPVVPPVVPHARVGVSVK